MRELQALKKTVDSQINSLASKLPGGQSNAVATEPTQATVQNQGQDQEETVKEYGAVKVVRQVLNQAYNR